MEPDFTIVTASYNYGKFIGDCLESVATQKGVTFEHLVFDGGSTDETAGVVARFPHVKFVQEPDNGMCDAINKGFRAARGKWVMWLNSDDRLRPGALAAVKAFAKEHDKTDVVFGCWNFIDAEGLFLRRMTLFPYLHKMICYYGCYIGSTSTFFRRESVIEDGNFLNERFRYIMDGEYFARLYSLGKDFTYFPAVLADFRWHGENLSIRNFGKLTVDDWLTTQKQYAETLAIRRAYGGFAFRNENLNRIRDGVRYFYWKGIKKILKMVYLAKLRKIDVEEDDSRVPREG